MEQSKRVLSVEQEKSAKNLTLVIYILQALSFFAGITGLVAIIINYVKWDDVQGTWLESHFRWQVRTFWFGLLWTAVGMVTIVLFIGFIILAANTIWIVYRIVKGWLRLNDGLPVGEYFSS